MIATTRHSNNVNLVPRLGVYPGSFNPPTLAHIQIALVARTVHHLQRVDFAFSVSSLGKESVAVPSLDHRVEVMRASIAAIDGLGVVVTEQQLIADIAAPYDVVVMGADKWAQVNDPVWYADEQEMAESLARLPQLALAPRPPHEVAPEHALDLPRDLLEVSSSGVRAGRREWMTAAAAAFDEATGAWSDPGRYEKKHH